MKKYIMEFLRRGLITCGFGPIVLAILYLILNANGELSTLGIDQVCIGIFSLTALAFIAGGMNAVYQIESLPLMPAIFIHGIVLYVSYLVTYLLNDWLELGAIPILVFSAIFVVGYLAIWAVIYAIVKKNTAKINEILQKNQQNMPNR